MVETIAPLNDAADMEYALRADLARGDAMIGSVAPILRHLLANEEHSLFGDDVIAAVRGMIRDLAGQLLEAVATGAGNGNVQDPTRLAGLVEDLVENTGLLTHIHALALETQLTNRLEARLSLDPVLSPLLQALIASSESETAAAGMALLASQARFVQGQRRMQLPLAELPGDLLHAVLLTLRAQAVDDAEWQMNAAAADQAIRGDFDEGRSRLGLIARLIAGMGAGATAALAIGHAGAAIFVSALGIAARQDRDMVALATNESQCARLLLALRAAGLKAAAIEEQFAALHPELVVPEGSDLVGVDQAAAILAQATPYPDN